MLIAQAGNCLIAEVATDSCRSSARWCVAAAAARAGFEARAGSLVLDIGRVLRRVLRLEFPLTGTESIAEPLVSSGSVGMPQSSGIE
jgi:hypothetical protein